MLAKTHRVFYPATELKAPAAQTDCLQVDWPLRLKLLAAPTDFYEVRRVLRVRLQRNGGAEDGVTLVEVMIAIVLILSVSLLATTSVTTSLNEGEVGTQRLQAARILSTLLSTGGCGSTSTVSELGTTFSASVSPGSCSGGGHRDRDHYMEDGRHVLSNGHHERLASILGCG